MTTTAAGHATIGGTGAGRGNDIPIDYGRPTGDEIAVEMVIGTPEGEKTHGRGPVGAVRDPLTPVAITVIADIGGLHSLTAGNLA